MRTPVQNSTVPTRRGMSLLEVLLSIAILGVSLVIVGKLVNAGYRSATEARIRTEAAIHCDAIMAEVAAGAIDVGGASGSVPMGSGWTYNVSSGPGVQPGLLSVTVTVTQSSENANPLSQSVVRFMPDPDYEPEDPLQ